jgi:hypothetical protein
MSHDAEELPGRGAVQLPPVAGIVMGRRLPTGGFIQRPRSMVVLVGEQPHPAVAFSDRVLAERHQQCASDPTSPRWFGHTDLIQLHLRVTTDMALPASPHPTDHLTVLQSHKRDRPRILQERRMILHNDATELPHRGIEQPVILSSQLVNGHPDILNHTQPDTGSASPGVLVGQSGALQHRLDLVEGGGWGALVMRDQRVHLAVV